MRIFILLLVLGIQLNGNTADGPCIKETQYVPLITMGETPEDITALSYVDDKFKADTNSWHIYKKHIDSITLLETKHYCDKDIRQESFYLDQKLVLVKTFRTSGGLIKSQYYKNGNLFLALTSLDHNGKFDLKQFFLNGTHVFTEFTSGADDKDNTPRWQKAYP